MYFFDSNNAFAVCIYNGIAQFIGFYCLFFDYSQPELWDPSFQAFIAKALVCGATWFVGSRMFWRNRSEKVVVLGQFLGLLGMAFIAGRSIGAVADFLDGGWWAEYLNLSLGLVCGAFLLYASHHLMRRDQDRMQRLRPVLIVLTGIMLVTRLIQLPLEEFYISDYVDGITSCFLFFFVLLSLFDEDIISQMTGRSVEMGHKAE